MATNIVDIILLLNHIQAPLHLHLGTFRTYRCAYGNGLRRIKLFREVITGNLVIDAFCQLSALECLFVPPLQQGNVHCKKRIH